MKRILMMMLLFVLCLSQAKASGNVYVMETVSSDSLVGRSLRQLNGQMSITLLEKVRSEMARISDMYPESWLPRYYQSLMGIQIALFTRNEQGGMLDDCLKKIEKLEQLKTADPSEVHALKAYYFYVKIAMNAKENGALYYSHVFGECEKALTSNPQNPRALAIEFVFKKQMGAFMHTEQTDDSKQVLTISDLFDQESKNTILPHWGKELLSYINRK